MLGLDSVPVESDVTVLPGRRSSRPGVRRRVLPPERIVVISGIPCTDGLQTLVDLAVGLDDLGWEQALESALRRRLTVAELEAALPSLGQARTPGVARMRRVLALRPPGAPATESLLETLMLQLIRATPELPEPERQVTVRNQDCNFVARVDLAWPSLGIFVELDGEHHKGQPVYDSMRQTAVTAATGWLCGRFTWTEVVRYPTVTRRGLVDLADHAGRRAEGPGLR
jgi:hypothetical protein